MGSPSTFTIKELTGTKHELKLQGRALPYRPITFSGTMKAEFAWYPGNPIATVQMIGAQEGTTSIKGFWKDRFIKTTTDLGLPVIGQTGIATLDNLEISDVMSLVEAVNRFRLRGQQLEVTWDRIVRRGVLTKFDFTPYRQEDVEWEMEFTWMSRGEKEIPIGMAMTSSLTNLINKILDAVDTLVSLIEQVQEAFAAIQSVVNAITDAVTSIIDAASSLASLATQLAKSVMAPVSLVRSIAAACQTIIDGCKSVEGVFRSVPARAIRAYKDVKEMAQSEVLDADYRVRQVRRAARAARVEAAKKRQEMLATSLQQPPLAVFTAQGDSDLRDVARRYYGSTNEWRTLALYNGFQSSKLTAGDLVIVPPASVLADPNPSTVGSQA